MSVLHAVDWAIIAVYFAIIMGLAWWVIRQKQQTSTDYFLAGRHLGWLIVGASIFASNIGSEHLVGLAGSGATDGVAMAHYELHAWCLLVLGWVMVPFYMRSKVFTMPEFLERRFSPTSRTVLSLISLVAYVLTKIAVGIFAGGIVFSVLLPEVRFLGLDSFWIGSILVIVFTGIYTILGGLKAVAYTEAMQTFVLIIGSALVTYFGLKALGGWGELRAIAGSEMFNLWKPLVPAGIEAPGPPSRRAGRMAWYFNDNYPWIGMLFCAPIIGLWYWCTDQYIVQRALGAPNEREARRGSIAAAFFKLLPVFIFIIPGMIAFALAKSGQSPGPPAGALRRGRRAHPGQRPEGLPPARHDRPARRGAGHRRGRAPGRADELAGRRLQRLLDALHHGLLLAPEAPRLAGPPRPWMGRLATTVMVLIGLAWIPVIRGGRGLYDYLQGVQSYLAPPIFVVFFFGVFMKRLNAKGCLAALVTGSRWGCSAWPSTPRSRWSPASATPRARSSGSSTTSSSSITA
jgi:solute:Na+ symporter, SSS family